MTGCGDFSLRSKRQKRAVAPSEARGPSALAGSPFLVTPRRKPRGLTPGGAVPSLFCHPERSEGCLATLGMTKEGLFGMTKEGLLGRTIKRMLGRTKIGGSTGPKRGGSAGQGREDFFKQPQRLLDFAYGLK